MARIVDVVGNTTQTGAERGEQVEYYTQLTQWPAAVDLHRVVRTHPDPRRHRLAALGAPHLVARPGDLRRRVGDRAARRAAGLAPAWAGNCALQHQLCGISGNDVPTYAVRGLLLLVAALAAGLLPARRAGVALYSQESRPDVFSSA